jgi:hypothetical protein
MGKAAKVIKIDHKKMDNDFLSTLEETEVQKPKKKKSKGSAPVDVPETVANAVIAFNNAKADKKAAEAEMKKHSPVIIDHVKAIQDEDGFNGNFRKSYDVDAGDGNKVKFVSKNQFSIKNDDTNLIKDILGDAFSELIKKKFNIKLKNEVFESRALQKELMELIGKENFATFFETTSILVPVDDFDKKIYDYVDKDELEDLRTFVKPYKPTLR